MKTYVLDASAIFAFIQNKPGATKVKDFLEQALLKRARALMSAANYGEVYGGILRRQGQNRAMAAIHTINSFPIEVLDLSLLRSIQAADAKEKYSLYYIDACAAALAIEHKATLVTSDSDFRKLGSHFPIVWLKP